MQMQRVLPCNQVPSKPRLDFTHSPDLDYNGHPTGMSFSSTYTQKYTCTYKYDYKYKYNCKYKQLREQFIKIRRRKQFRAHKYAKRYQCYWSKNYSERLKRSKSSRRKETKKCNFLQTPSHPKLLFMQCSLRSNCQWLLNLPPATHLSMGHQSLSSSFTDTIKYKRAGFKHKYQFIQQQQSPKDAQIRAPN